MVGSSCSFIVATGELATGVGTAVSCTVGATAAGSVKNGSSTLEWVHILASPVG